MKFVTFHYESIKSEVPALEMILAAHTEMIKNKLIDYAYEGVDVHSGHEAILLFKDEGNKRGKLIGISTFYQMETAVWISLSYVKPRYRNNGGWTVLRNAVRRQAISYGKDFVLSGVFNINEASMTANSKHGTPCVTIFKQSVRD